MANTIEYNGINYEVVFNLNVMEKIQEEYGSVEAWGELTEGAEPNAKAIKFGFTEMINEGIDIYNEDNANKDNFTPRNHFTLAQIGRIISNIGLAATANAISQTVVDSTKSDEKN